MKYAFLFYLIVAISIASCSSSSSGGGKPKNIQRDTSRMLGVFVDFEKKSVHYGPMYLIVKDTLMFAMEDSSTFKKKWTKDTLYFTPRVIYDSVAKKDTLLVFPQYIRESVSLERNLDSAIKTLERWIKNNPQFFKSDKKVDTTKNK